MESVNLTTLDWIIIIGFLVIIIGIGLSFTKRVSGSLADFFLGGRNLPWYIAGVSMVATTFAADTPLAVTELVVKYGVSGNWLWWNMLAGAMLTTFFFSHLWRRSAVMTELELIEMRYHGKAASFLRGLKSLYLGLFLNCLIIGWVNLALMTLLDGFFDLGAFKIIGIEIKYSLIISAFAMFLVAIYSALSGLLGVAITDFIQFFVAMAGCIILAVIVLQSEQIGGAAGLKEKLPPGSLDYFPTFNKASDGITGFVIGAGSFLTMITMQWWASWYPGAEPGGGGYVAQRMLSARSVKDAYNASLFFSFAHYCLRPWPWIIVALCAAVLYPELANTDPKMGYVYAMKEFLPNGLKGLLLVAFFAAYMSTISTQLNWGSSYLVNDLYLRFIGQRDSQKQLVLVSRLATLFIMIIGIIVTSMINSITGVWSFLIECGAGLGLVLILRWYWWRINVWSEIAATVIPFFAYGLTKLIFVKFDPAWGKGLTEDPRSFLFTVFCTTVGWILITFLTKPEPTEHLQKFYNKVKPGGVWAKISGTNEGHSNLIFTFVAWLAAIVMAYSILFATGRLIFMEWISFGGWMLVSIIAFFILRFGIQKSNLFAED